MGNNQPRKIFIYPLYSFPLSNRGSVLLSNHEGAAAIIRWLYSNITSGKLLPRKAFSWDAAVICRVWIFIRGWNIGLGGSWTLLPAFFSLNQLLGRRSSTLKNSNLVLLARLYQHREQQKPHLIPKQTSVLLMVCMSQYSQLGIDRAPSLPLDWVWAQI